MKTLNIKDPEAYRLAHAMAKETGETMTRIVTEALRERFEKLHGRPRRANLDELISLAQQISDHAPKEYKSHGELFYDDLGLPK